MTLKNLYKKAKERGAKVVHRDDGNYRLKYPAGYNGNKKTSGVTYVSGFKCYVCGIECLQAWSTWKKGRKATCTRKCMDRGMFHDMQDKHDGKWWDDYRLDHQGYYLRKRKDPETVRMSRHKANFISHHGREPKKGYHLHHINMVKTDNDIVSNIIELPPKRHLELHGTYNTLCKGLMDDGIIGFNSKTGYFRKEKANDR